MRRLNRRGSTAVEFALVFSLVLFPLLVSTIEAGVYVHQVDSVAEAVTISGRAAAGVAYDDDPAGTFELHLDSELFGRGVLPSPVLKNRIITTSVSGDPPNRVLDVAVQFEYGGVVGILPTPDFLKIKRRFRLEDQQE